jgi:hypothetical protein
VEGVDQILALAPTDKVQAARQLLIGHRFTNAVIAGAAANDQEMRPRLDRHKASDGGREKVEILFRGETSDVAD